MAISGALIWDFESDGAALNTETLVTLGAYSEMCVRYSETKFRMIVSVTKTAGAFDLDLNI